MDPGRWRTIRNVFEEALDLPASAREEFIRSACGSDPDLRLEVLRMLASHSAACEFLESPPSLVLDLKHEADLRPVFQPGDLVAKRFRIVRFVAQGGMGEVYEARDEVLEGVTVALKTVRAPFASDERLRARFRSEVELARKVTHPNVCRIHDVAIHQFEGCGEAAGLLVLTMELLAGETLADRLRRDGPLDGEAGLQFARQVLEALGAAHSAGVLHGDIKPNNVMLVPGEFNGARAVVTDFGLAHGLSRGASGEWAGNNSMGAGSPAYMAPEILEGGPLSASSDMFAVGVLLYEACTGKRPFPEVRTFEDARKNAGAAAAPPRRHAPRMAQRLEKLILRCLDPEPRARCGSAAEALACLGPSSFAGKRLLLGVGFLLMAAASVAGWMLSSARDTIIGPVRTVVVLPFENGSGDAEAGYFVEGLTGEIREALAKVPRTRVLARYSSSEISRARLSYAGVGARLGASYLVAGNVRRADGRLRVKVSLVEASSGLEKWRYQFDKPETEAVTARLEISTAIALHLLGAVTPQARRAMAQGGTQNSKAFDLYLQAREAMNTRTTEDLVKAVDLLSSSLSLDPRFAAAWTAQAEARELLAGRDEHPFIESMTDARQGVLRALELDAELPEAQLEMAVIRQRYEWDWKGAEVAFRTSAALNSNSMEAHRLFAGFLSNLGRGDEALNEIEQARALDPLSVRVRQLHAVILLRARQFSAAASELEQLLKANPEYSNLYAYAGDAYAYSGQWAKAVELHREAVRRFGAESQFLYNLAYTLAMTGQKDDARAIALDLERRWPAENFLPTYLAKVWIGLGDADRAFYWLEKAWTERDASLMVLNVEPWYDPYRSDPRFRDLVKRLKLDAADGVGSSASL